MELQQGLSEPGAAGPQNPTEDELAVLDALGTETAPGKEGEAQGAAPSGATGEPDEGFFNAADVPQGLQATFRAMQGANTQLRQKLRDQERDLQARGQEMDQSRLQLAAQVKDAQTYQQLLGDPAFKQFLVQRAGGGSAGVNTQDPDLDPETARVLERATAPLSHELAQLKGQLKETQEQQQAASADSAALAQFLQTHPDWKKYEDGMQQAWKEDQRAGRPFRSRVDAYNHAFRQRVESLKEARRLQRQKVGVESTGVAGTPQPKPVEVDSIEGAFREAARQMGEDPEKFLQA